MSSYLPELKAEAERLKQVIAAETAKLKIIDEVIRLYENDSAPKPSINLKRKYTSMEQPYVKVRRSKEQWDKAVLDTLQELEIGDVRSIVLVLKEKKWEGSDLWAIVKNTITRLHRANKIMFVEKRGKAPFYKLNTTANG